jgi:G3E family GTPase
MEPSGCSSLTRSVRNPNAIPVTVLTGFLGSGKTTLLNHLLREKKDLRIAVIENEFGEIGIDNDLVFTAKENLFELSAGCVCCTVRPALMKILDEVTRGPLKYDHIVIETTGLADPAPVAQTFFVDDRVKQKAHLNTVVTVVDAMHLLQHIEESRACLDQIAFADTILINKCDLATPEEIARVEARIRATNSTARILHVTFGKAPAEAILDQGGFDLDRALESKPAFLQAEYPFEHASTYRLEKGMHEIRLKGKEEDSIGLLLVPKAGPMRDLERDASAIACGSVVDEVRSGTPVRVGIPVMLSREGPGQVKAFPVEIPKPGEYVLFAQFPPDEFGLTLRDAADRPLPSTEQVDYTLGHVHDHSVTSVSIGYKRKVDEQRVSRWLTELLREKSTSIYRLKGIVDVEGRSNRRVIHGVHSLLNITDDRPWSEGEVRGSQLVFIGRGLDKRALKQGFRQCLR